MNSDSKKDIGLDEYMKRHLSAEDYDYQRKVGKE